MSDAKKFAMLIIGIIVAISFINRGQLAVSSTPSGASANIGYYGLVK